MCFSPQADFSGGAVIAGVGLATLHRVRGPRELIVGALPLLFGLHQITEGFVWLGFDAGVSAGVASAAKLAYIVFAHVILPIIVPVGFLLIEPDRHRRRFVLPLVALGTAMGIYLLWQVTAFPVGAHEEAHCVDYTTHTPNDVLIGLLYVAATCGPALLSSRPYLRCFGVVSVVGVIVTAIVRVDELTSLWCVYVAVVSMLIFEHFRRTRASERVAETSPLPGPAS